MKFPMNCHDLQVVGPMNQKTVALATDPPGKIGGAKAPRDFEDRVFHELKLVAIQRK
ncbi:MAG TPA: hypothetical protein VHO03_06465 [Ignavibacteriales bacterium]|nr:hypothetical protein [Ignavibacteriales bacterium]